MTYWVRYAGGDDPHEMRAVRLVQKPDSGEPWRHRACWCVYSHNNGLLLVPDESVVAVRIDTDSLDKLKAEIGALNE